MGEGLCWKCREHEAKNHMYPDKSPWQHCHHELDREINERKKIIGECWEKPN